ncbi:hypothetical protein F5Y05DRAFT_416966 [Hypoxylon sp. FL0543]|nr:hypothetical protein F5Y05DRAFT_416966 [Hypoxylon sp. FL0543]
MTSYQLASIYEIRDQINRLRSIPTAYYKVLEDRLVIACGEFKRQDRSEKPRSLGQIKARHAQKKANEVYLRILDEDPQIFLPFIVAISTNASCAGFDLKRFLELHDKRANLCLGTAGRATLQNIARRRGIESSIAFERLIQSLFPNAESLDGPITTAEGPEAWHYKGAMVGSVRSEFALGVCEAISKAPLVGESAQYSTQATTGSVRMDFPSINSQDCILLLDVGDVDHFESVLFPTAFRMPALSNLRKFSYTLRGASLAAAALIFGSQLYEAIDTSQMRIWEKDKKRPTDTTECIAMEVHAHEPIYGTLRLRLEFLRGLRIAQHLFADQNQSGG